MVVVVASFCLPQKEGKENIPGMMEKYKPMSGRRNA